MTDSGSRKAGSSKVVALKLTIFTTTHITTASQYVIMEYYVAANAHQSSDTNCISLTVDMRARHGLRRCGRSALSNQNNIALKVNWRIPFPSNDNLSPLHA